uniref:Uncharacterized protein n=1 Tax=Arundo donax TaxID=35708 RepID=A0A0A9HJE4_ARUDO
MDQWHLSSTHNHRLARCFNIV